MNPILKRRIADVKACLTRVGIVVVEEKEINYGCKLTCTKGADKASVNVYYGKKGFSTVIQGKTSALKETLQDIMSKTHQIRGKSASHTHVDTPVGSPIRPSGISSWIGCDESGKGDVFGPLCAAACLITPDEEAYFQKLGVCDSKALTDGTILNLDETIRKTLGDRCAWKVLMPSVYNERYKACKKSHENLNHLLGRVHSENILCLLSKYNCPCIIVDKFGKDEYVLRPLQKVAQDHRIIQVPRGERDTAVAAASIVARAAFVRAMKSLCEHYGMVFPKGAYAGISGALHEFRRRYGDDELHCVGKLNFKTFDFLR